VSLLDSSHGSAYLSVVPDSDAHCDQFLSTLEVDTSVLRYRGCTAARPRRGVARTGPRARALLAATCRAVASAIVLELGEAPYAGVPCWTGRAERWARWTVPLTYDLRYDTDARPRMGANQISRCALLRIAEARARYADHTTGRDCRPSNHRLAKDTGYDVRTIKRANTVLRLLGVATEILRGRRRTRAERFASWRVGDRGRGWASVWALHDNPLLNNVIHKLQGALSPHPEGSLDSSKPHCNSVVTTSTRRRSGAGNRGAQRRSNPDKAGLALAQAWRTDPHAPSWSRRHSPTGWAAMLAAPAAHSWTPRDLNQLITDWLGVGHWIPDTPHKPIGLLGAILAWHGTDNLADRPAAADEAREAAEAAAHQVHLAAQQAAHLEHERAREVGRRALAGAGRAAARMAAAQATRRAAHKRARAVAEDTARLAAIVEAARGADDFY
jgi:hypothetical protein